MNRPPTAGIKFTPELVKKARRVQGIISAGEVDEITRSPLKFDALPWPELEEKDWRWPKDYKGDRREGTYKRKVRRNEKGKFATLPPREERVRLLKQKTRHN